MGERALPLAAMEKILKNAGAERVSDNAKVALESVLGDIAEGIASKEKQLRREI